MQLAWIFLGIGASLGKSSAYKRKPEDIKMSNKNLVCVGTILKAHGIRGDVKIKSFTDNPQGIGAYGPLLLEGPELVSLTIKSLRVVAADFLIVKFREIQDRTKAESLVGRNLFISKQALPPVSEEEFYIHDLEGLEVRSRQDQAVLGRITAVFNFGAGPLLEIQQGKGEPSVLLPFTDPFVGEVNLEEGFLEVDAESFKFFELEGKSSSKIDQKEKND